MLSQIKLLAEKMRCDLQVEIQTKKPCSAHLGTQLFEQGLTVDLEPAPESIQELLISATIWRNQRIVESGQCRTSVRDLVPYLTKDKGDALRELCKLWERWHLNGMIGGSRAQREALTEAAKTDPDVWSHVRSIEHLTARKLHPDRGYSYGQAWLVEPLPEDIVKKVGRLCVDLGGKVIDL